MVFFRGAQNLVINGGHFAQINNQQTGPRSGNGLDAIRERSALNALLDSNERFDPPKCNPDTRLAIIDHIMNWIESKERRASMLWLHGPAGAGKSALEQTIAELCQSQDVLLASFFFSRTVPNRSDGNSLISTLAYQLMSAIPLIRSYVKAYIKQDPNIFHRTRDVQMRKLVLEPLNSLRARISIYFKKKIASEGRYRHRWCWRSGGQKINLAFDQNANRDIHTFLVKEFQEIRRLHPQLPSSWPLEDDIQALVRKASGQFIYASTVVDFLKSADHRPDDRLKVVLGLSPPHDNDAPFTQLDALYSYILSTGKNIQASLSVLALLILPSARPKVVSLLPPYTRLLGDSWAIFILALDEARDAASRCGSAMLAQTQATAERRSGYLTNPPAVVFDFLSPTPPDGRSRSVLPSTRHHRTAAAAI
ncbi:unnamed protein product [Cyclocybe aegerita]|uniref:Nephrocystin 3-like N-terminal domain-containing protein n=1 Tax=Cyclocybe aegerita TaxID=1973307 RepID=A0A8S0WI55_CYCAE|nr:unnamed protein product [Cyclocybe aegerita]